MFSAQTVSHYIQHRGTKLCSLVLIPASFSRFSKSTSNWLVLSEQHAT